MTDAAPSPLATPEPWNLVADGYVTHTLPLFEKYAMRALELADLAPRSWVLDVAAGPGTLALLAAKLGHHVSAVDFSPVMVARLRERAKLSGLEVAAEVANGQALPQPAQAYEGAFSMFGLIFFPDREVGARELHRVLKPQGRCVVSSWTPMESVPVLATMGKAMRAQLPGLPFGDGKAPLGGQDDVRELLEGAGFTRVQVEQVAVEDSHISVRALWESFEHGGAPCVMLKAKLGDGPFASLRAGVIAELEREFGTGPVSFGWKANLGLGYKR